MAVSNAGAWRWGGAGIGGGAHWLRKNEVDGAIFGSAPAGSACAKISGKNPSPPRSVSLYVYTYRSSKNKPSKIFGRWWF